VIIYDTVCFNNSLMSLAVLNLYICFIILVSHLTGLATCF